jgi:spermidine synthase
MHIDIKQKPHLAGLVMGKEIHRAVDELGTVVVYENFGERFLSFDSFFEQSCASMTTPFLPVHEYAQVMLVALAFGEPRHVTLLGLGGGTLATCIHHYFDDVTIHAVELRQIVIDAAFGYFYLPSSARLTVTCDDVQGFLKNAEAGSADLIFSDLYNAHDMSPLQLQKTFIAQCYELLSVDGWLVINYHHAPQIESPLVKQIQAIFAVVYVCSISSGNWILFCGKSTRLPKRSLLQDKCKRLEKLMNKPFTRFFNRLVRFGV